MINILASTNTKEEKILSHGQAILILDETLLNEVVSKVVRQAIAEYRDVEQTAKDDDELVEQHVAAKIVGKNVRTLRNWSKAGVLDVIVPPSGRPIYYYMRQIRQIKEGFIAPKRTTFGSLKYADK